jgi:hypothetical protein
MIKANRFASSSIAQRLISNKISPTSYLHIFVLWGFAVAQPLYDLFARYSDFFIAHDALPEDIILLAGLLSIGIPLLLAVSVFVTRAISAYTQTALHHALLGALMMLFVVLILKKLQLQPDDLLFALAALLSTAFLCTYVLFSPVRDAMTWLAITVLVFPIIFLTLSPVKQLISPKKIVGHALHVGEQDIPIVFIIFDEIPLVSLLDENHAIDPVRYPHFSELSQTAYWFRNYTVNAPDTKLSVPIILTGKYPEKAHPMAAEYYPDSMFTILASNYRIVAEGLSKNIVPNNLRAPQEAPSRRSIVEQLSMMSLDMSVVYLHMVLPTTIARRLPPVTDNWNNFFVPSMSLDSSFSSNAIQNGEIERPTGKKIMGYKKVRIFEYFMESLTNARHAKPTLYYFHSGLAHNPWFLAPSGRMYGSFSVPGYRRDKAYVDSLFGFGGKRWSNDKWLVNQGYQRHLFEVSRADAMIGEVTSRLKELGLFDRSLIVVTSDHGCSFEPGNRTRGNENTAPGDTMSVPFIIKLPYQKERVISDANTEAIDVLPTIADILQVELPFPIDGESMFNTSTPTRKTKTMVYPMETGELERLVVDANNESRNERLQNKLSIFGSGTTNPNGYFAIGPFGSLVGKKISELSLFDSEDLTIEFEQRNIFDHVDINSTTFIPIYVSGKVLQGAPTNEKVNLAIAVNGRVQAVTQIYNTKLSMTPRFYAMLPESSLKQGSNQIDFYVIELGKDDQIVLSIAARKYPQDIDVSQRQAIAR